MHAVAVARQQARLSDVRAHLLNPLPRVSAMMLIGVGAALLAGCSSTPDLDAAAAQSTYGPVLREIAADTTAATGIRWTDGSAGGVGMTTDGCTWFSPTLQSETDLATPSRWNEVIAATDATLLKHSFDVATPSELKGGYTGVESHDQRDARLLIDAKGRTTLKIQVPVNDTC